MRTASDEQADVVERYASTSRRPVYSLTSSVRESRLRPARRDYRIGARTQ